MPNGNDPATLRDLMRLQELISIQIAEVKTLRIVDRENEQKALDLATMELHRRLDGLNHEAARIKEVRDNSVTREAFVLTTAEHEKRLRAVETEQSELRGKASQKSVDALRAVSIVSLIISLVALAIKFL